MANTLTVKTGYTAGVTVRSDGFTPVVCKRFDTAKLGIVANAQVVALKVPKGSILRHVIVDVKTAGTGTLAVGSHVGGLSDSGITTVTDTYDSGTADVVLTATGKTLYSPTQAIVAADHYIVVTPSAAQAAAVFEVTAVVDVFDVEAYAG